MGRQSPALIAIHKTSAGSISFLILGYDATASSYVLLADVKRHVLTAAC